MKRLLFLLAILPTLAFAQLQLYSAPQGGAEKPVSGLFEMGSVAVADSASTRFRLRNNGSATVTLAELSVSGSGFSKTGDHSLPFLIAPGVNFDFTVHFSPPNYGKYEAQLKVNSTLFPLLGYGLPGAAVRVNGEDLLTNAAIDFGRVERGSTSSVTVLLVNNSTESVAIPLIGLTGSSFAFTEVNPAPLNLPPGQTRGFDIRFSSPGAGIATGSLTVDRRAFRLTGSGFEPNMPRPTIIIQSPSIRSAEQGKVSIQLESVSRANAKGVLRMEVRPSGNAKDNDSTAQFISGSRTVAFDVVPGNSTIKLRGEDSIVFQSGTTAGTIVFVVEAGGFTEQATVAVAPEAIRLDKSGAVRSRSALDITLTGFDNTRSIGDMSFTFFTANGQPLLNMPVRIPVKTDFDRWWNLSTFGGIFEIKASFPVNGDSSMITAVEAQITNSAGTTATQRITF